MSIDPKLLSAFRDVMETQSMTGAARLAGLTQPAISAQIARLESKVGFELFDRVGGRLKASDRGRQFYEEVRTALDSLDRLDKIANGIRSGSSGEITIASHPNASISILPDAVARLRAVQPDARILMINRASERVRAVFEAGGADIGVAEGPINVMEGVVLKRFRIECCAILPLDHPLAAEEVIVPEHFRDLPFIAMSEARGIGHMTKRLFAGAGIPFSPVVVSEYYSAICRLVARGAGVALVDRASAETFESGGLVIRRFEPRVDYEVCMFFRNTPPPSPLAEALMTEIVSVLEGFAGQVPLGRDDAAPQTENGNP